MKETKFFKRNNGSKALIQIVSENENEYNCIWGFGSGNTFPYAKYKFDVEFVEVSKEEIEKLERQRCGRRGESVAMLEKEPLPDYWVERTNGDKTCSFCGSLHPDVVLNIIKEHGFSVIDHSDKNYKWYINRPSVSNAMEGGIKYYRQHDTTEFIEGYNELYNFVSLNANKH